MLKEKKNRALVLPSEDDVKAERKRLKYRRRFIITLRTTVYALTVVAAIAVLLATLFLPVLQVSGSSMEPTLSDDDIILLIKTDNLSTGDLIGFYYQNKLLLKRVIGVAGDVIDIDEEGNVTVNGELLDEPYVTNKSIGECNIDLPYQVPENRVFVMGDNRATSIDSRSSVIGCIEEDQIVGKVLIRIYPFKKISFIN
ncbi:MAG: signal peptidase I [Oscillospiraceae bacterium]|nr:signal peptidase I [Oscillospiraceae bacterium]